MSVTLDLSPEQEQRLRREARTRGLDTADLLQQLLLDALDRLEGAAPATSRVPGLHAGHTRIRADFDAPLPDSFWAGSE